MNSTKRLRMKFRYFIDNEERIHVAHRLLCTSHRLEPVERSAHRRIVHGVLSQYDNSLLSINKLSTDKRTLTLRLGSGTQHSYEHESIR